MKKRIKRMSSINIEVPPEIPVFINGARYVEAPAIKHEKGGHTEREIDVALVTGAPIACDCQTDANSVRTSIKYYDPKLKIRQKKDKATGKIHVIIEK